MKLSHIRTAIKAVAQHWKNEGDTGSVKELRSDAFLHFRWLLERYPADKALNAMRGMGKLVPITYTYPTKEEREKLFDPNFSIARLARNYNKP